MAALLIGESLATEVFSLNKKLRENTLSYSQNKFGIISPRYSPWLCFAPIVEQIPAKLLQSSYTKRGGLLVDPDEIDELATFISGEGISCLDGLPGEKALWLPSLDGISREYEQAAILIRSSGKTLELLFDAIVDVVVPLGGGRNRGYSTHFARGAIFRSLPDDNDACDVAFDVVHELGHQVLMIWQSIDPIIVSDPEALIYSQIRKKNRPAIQSYHATVALAYMLYLKQRNHHLEGMIAAAERRGASYSTSLENSLELAIASIRDGCELSDIGSMMLSEMEALL